MTHLGYCTNIHPGEGWADHFQNLKTSVPAVKAAFRPDAPLGLGLRLANEASLALSKYGALAELKSWLAENDLYVFTMNGFPYGGFHGVRVKDQVHAPDWTTTDRRDYTIRLFRLLADLLPDGLDAGGVSTSPLSYRFWWKTPEAQDAAVQKATRHLLEVVDDLIDLRRTTGKILHLDIEPEPDGILENSAEFIGWYETVLQPAAEVFFAEKRKFTKKETADRLRVHVRLCYDVCHFAVGYEQPADVLAALDRVGIRVGKIQVSSALKVDLTEGITTKLVALAQFDEPTYLHQVVARRAAGGFDRYPDLPEALAAASRQTHAEWRVHFHVPLFLERYGVLDSTQDAVREVLRLQRERPFTAQLEVETYTWGVLPPAAQAPLNESIRRELEWVERLT